MLHSVFVIIFVSNFISQHPPNGSTPSLRKILDPPLIMATGSFTILKWWSCFPAKIKEDPILHFNSQVLRRRDVARCCYQLNHCVLFQRLSILQNFACNILISNNLCDFYGKNKQYLSRINIYDNFCI